MKDTVAGTVSGKFAGAGGLEPPKTLLESVVLPLHHAPKLFASGFSAWQVGSPVFTWFPGKRHACEQAGRIF